MSLLKSMLSVPMALSQGQLASVPAGLQPFTASLQWETSGHCSCLQSTRKEIHDPGSCDVKLEFAASHQSLSYQEQSSDRALLSWINPVKKFTHLRPGTLFETRGCVLNLFKSSRPPELRMGEERWADDRLSKQLH